MNFLAFLIRSAPMTFVASAFTGGLAGLAGAWVISLTYAQLSRGTATHSLIWLFAGLCLFKLAAGLCSEILLIRASQNAAYQLRLGLCRRILDTPLMEIEFLGKDRLLPALTDDVTTLANSLREIPVCCISLFIVLGCLCYIGFLSLPILVTVLAFVAVGIVIYHLMSMRAVQMFVKTRELQDLLFNSYLALVDGNTQLKLNTERRKSFVVNRLIPQAASFRDLQTGGMARYSTAIGTGQTLEFVCIGAVLFLLPGVANVGNSGIVGCILAILYMGGPLQAIVAKIPSFVRAKSVFKRLDSLGMTLAPAENGTEVIRPSRLDAFESITLENTTYHYRERHQNNSFCLGPINLQIKRGELVFLVGGNGSGKTTLAKVIAGLYPPAAGTLYWNGEPVSHHRLQAYREQIAAHFSEFHLFRDLVGPHQESLERRARNYLSRLGLDAKVFIRDGSFSTTALSRGERKRLALISACIEDRPFYLFDEWAADQDPEFRHFFYTELLPEMTADSKTVVVITHDDRYFSAADRVLYLDQGQLTKRAYN